MFYLINRRYSLRVCPQRPHLEYRPVLNLIDKKKSTVAVLGKLGLCFNKNACKKD